MPASDPATRRLAPQRPDGEPPMVALDPPMMPFAIAGTAAWAVAGLILLIARDWLIAHHRTWWLWTCVAGVAVGALGCYLMYRHDARRRARQPDPGA